MQPRQRPVAPFEVRVELGLLRDPEDAERQEAREVRQQPRALLGEQAGEVGLGFHALGRRHLQVEDQERHGDREDAVGQAREPAEAASGEGAVALRGGHAGRG